MLSFFLRADTRAALYADVISGRTVIASFQTVAELLRGACERNWGERRREALESQLARLAIHPYSLPLAWEWAEIMTIARRSGRPLSTADGWVAATARLVGVPLVTHNRRDFAAVPGLEVISFA